MNLHADMMRDEPHDAFACRGRQTLTCVGKPFGQPIHPKAAVRVQEDFDDAGVFQKPRDGSAERGA